MISEAIQPVGSALSTQSTPWVNGQLPSPWSTPSSQHPDNTSFAQSLVKARSAVVSDTSLLPASVSAQVSATNAHDGGVSKKMGLASIENMGVRLSQADAKMHGSVESLNNLDPTSPNLQAELLSVSLLSTKAGISTTLAMKFSSKINESINTLLKTS